MFKQLFEINRKTFIIGLIAIALLIGMFQIKTQSPAPEALNNTNMEEHFQQNVQFFTKVVGSQEITKLYFAFSFKDQTYPITLSYLTKEVGKYQEFLIFDPQISLLTWPVIRGKNETLMQKQINYSTIADFLAQPKGKILIDYNLSQKYPHLKADILHENEQTVDATAYDYIFTTQAPIKYRNNTYYYENYLDTSDALLNDLNEISWVIRAWNATPEHPYYLSDIDVQFITQ